MWHSTLFAPSSQQYFQSFRVTFLQQHSSSKMTRKRLTNSQKLIILADVDERHATGESLGSIARSHGIQMVQIKKWRSKMPELAATKRTKKSLSRGNQGCLGQFEEQLVGWALDRQRKGLPFLYSKLMQKAYKFDLNSAI